MSDPYHQNNPWRPAPDNETIGELLTRVRSELGLSQLDLAERLCAAAGVATVTRNEISRWERESRIPSGRWLGRLAAVLGVPLAVLQDIAAEARSGPAPRGTPQQRPALTWDKIMATATGDRTALADPGTLRARVALLRRMDDLIGGVDLAATASADLEAVTGAGSPISGPLAAPLAELAQVTSWVLADAGDLPGAVRACRVGLRAAAIAGERLLTAHLLGCLAEMRAEAGSASGALRTARLSAVRVADAPAAVRTMAMHRVAYVAALCGHPAQAEEALLAAELAGGSCSSPGTPAWLYWLDEPALTALTGRCYAAIGRPRLARALLTDALSAGRLPPRARAVCGAWLGHASAGCGDLTAAGEIAGHATLAAVTSGSIRATRLVRSLDAQLRHQSDHPAVRGYAKRTAAAFGYLPDIRPAIWIGSSGSLSSGLRPTG